jgi:uncharacterized membrane protein
MLWIYFIQLSLEYNEMAFSVIQFLLSIPLLIFLANNAYLAGFELEYIMILVILLSSIYIVAYNYGSIKKVK